MYYQGVAEGRKLLAGLWTHRPASGCVEISVHCFSRNHSEDDLCDRIWPKQAALGIVKISNLSYKFSTIHPYHSCASDYA